MFSSFCEKLLPKMSNIFHEISKKPSYVRTEVGGWVGDDFGRTYCMDHPCTGYEL